MKTGVKGKVFLYSLKTLCAKFSVAKCKAAVWMFETAQYTHILKTGLRDVLDRNILKVDVFAL